jgi:hypothetical protein
MWSCNARAPSAWHLSQTMRPYRFISAPHMTHKRIMGAPAGILMCHPALLRRCMLWAVRLGGMHPLGLPDGILLPCYLRLSKTSFLPLLLPAGIQHIPMGLTNIYRYPSCCCLRSLRYSSGVCAGYCSVCVRSMNRLPQS